jgi:hypothetical protein
VHIFLYKQFIFVKSKRNQPCAHLYLSPQMTILSTNDILP